MITFFFWLVCHFNGDIKPSFSYILFQHAGDAALELIDNISREEVTVIILYI